MQLVTALASQIAVAQENQRLFNTAESGRQTLQSVLNSLPTGVLVIDAQSGATVLSNDLVQRLLGLDAFPPYERIHTGSGVPYEDEEFPPRRVLATGETVLAEDMSVLGAEGNRTDLLVNAAPVRDASGKVISAVAVFQDVTELRELENVLQESLRETTTLYESSRAIAAEYELGNILAVVSTQIDSLAAPDHLYIILSDAQKKVVQAFRAETRNGESVALVVEGECPVPRTILVADEAFVDSDVSQSPELARDTQLKALNIQSVGTFPLNARSRTIGWVVIGFSTGRVFTPEERRFLATIADQAAVAIESARLAQQTAQALSETTLLYEASYTINRADSIEAAIEVMRDQARHFAPSQIDIFLVNNKHEPSTIDWVVRWEASQGKPTPVDLSAAPTIDDWQFIEAAPFFVENVAMTSSPYIGIMSRMHNWGQFVAQASVPLSVKGRSTGRLVVSFNRTYRFGRLEQQFLTALADQGAIVIDNFALVQQTQDSLEETATLYQSSRAIADAPDLQTVLQSTIDYAVQPVVSRAMLIRLLSDSWIAPDVSIEIAADWTRTDEDLNLAGIRFTPSQFPIWPQLSAQEILWIEDMAEAFEVSDDSRSLYDTLNVRSLIVFPLSVGGRAIGALLMGSTEIWRRSEREIRIYSSLADQAAISMESRNLLEQAERRARQLQTSAQVSRAATSILDLDQLFDRTVNLIKDSFEYDHVQIFLVTPDNTDAQLVASTGEPGRQLLSIHHHLPVGSASVIGQVTSLGKPQIVSDTTDRRFVHRPNPYLPRTRAEMALPLIARNRIMGALDVQSNEPGAFTQEDVNVLSTLADQIAIAIDNAQLFELSTQRVDEMRFLFDATRAATTITTIGEESEEAFKGVTRLILEKLRATSATLALMDSTGTALLPYTVQAPGIVMSTPSHLPIDDTFVKGLAATRQPVLFNDLAGNVEPEIAQIHDTMKNIGSIVMMPLLSGEVLVGMLAVAKRERNGFNRTPCGCWDAGANPVAIIQRPANRRSADRQCPPARSRPAQEPVPGEHEP
jgi:GAF domain-containing protein